MDVISKNNQEGVENLLDAIDTSGDKVGLVKKSATKQRHKRRSKRQSSK